MTPADVQAMISVVIGVEGGYSNNPSDAGGPTMWGIAQVTARAHGYSGLMNQMPREVAVSIYLAIYWHASGFDQVAVLSSAIARKLFDTGVNCGVGTSTMMLQRALNVLNHEGKDYPDLTVDGGAGGVTMAALGAFLRIRGVKGEIVMLRALNCLQGERYIELCEKRQADEEFIFGWLANRIDQPSA